MPVLRRLLPVLRRLRPVLLSALACGAGAVPLGAGPERPTVLAQARPNLDAARRANGHFLAGNAAMQANQLDKAIAEYTEVIRLVATAPEPFQNRGLAFAMKGDLDRALVDFQRALKIKPDNVQTLRSLAEVFLKQGRVDQAIALASQALARDGNDTIALRLRSAGHEQKGDLAGFERDAARAVAVEPGNPQNQALLGAALLKKGENQRAVEVLNVAIRMDPNGMGAVEARGRAFDALRQPELALSDFDRVVHATPTNVGARIARGVIFFKLARFEACATDFREVMRLLPGNAEVQSALADCLVYSGDLAGGLAGYEAALRLDPRLSSAFAGRAHALARQGDIARAKADLEEARRLDPKNIDVFIFGGEVFLLAGEPEKALDSFEQSLALVPGKPGEAGRDKARALLAARGATGATPPAAANLPAVAAARPAPADLPTGESAPAVVAPGSRVALVIGNGRYGHGLAELPNPPNDARDLASALAVLGFEVTLAVDAGKAEMEQKLAAFARAARRSDVALAFYAGHGLQHQGVNYLAPVDARIEDETDLRLRFIKVQDLVEELQAAKGARILLLDACRDNEAIRQLASVLPRSRSAGIRRGLATEKAEGILIAFATQADRTAADGDGRNSPFTQALLKHLPTPGQEIRTLFTRVRSEVLRQTGGAQRPEVSDSLDGEFAFR